MHVLGKRRTNRGTQIRLIRNILINFPLQVCYGRRNQTLQVINTLSGNVVDEVDVKTDDGHLVGVSKVDEYVLTLSC